MPRHLEGRGGQGAGSAAPRHGTTPAPRRLTGRRPGRPPLPAASRAASARARPWLGSAPPVPGRDGLVLPVTSRRGAGGGTGRSAPCPRGRTRRHRAGTPGGTEAREGRDPPRGRTPWNPRGAGGDAPAWEPGKTWGLRTLLLGWGSAPCQGGLGGTGGQDQHRDTHGGRSLFTVIQGGPGTSAGSALWPEELLR